MTNGNFVPQKVLDHVANNNIKNKFFHVEGERETFETYFVDKDGIVERAGIYDDDRLNVIKVDLASIQAVVVSNGGAASDVNPNIPSEQHIKAYVDSLTTDVTSDQNSIVKPFLYANLGMVEYSKATNGEVIARYITQADPSAPVASPENTVHTIYTSENAHPKAVADVKALEEVINPTDGLVIQVLSELPIVSMYVFNTGVTKGIGAADGTTGHWGRIGESGYHAKNKLTPTDDVSNSTGTDAADALDNDNTTGWLSGAANADGVTPEIWHVIPTAEFRPNGYSFERTSFGVFSDTADEANEGEPGAWTFHGKLANGTWVELDSRSESVIKDSGPVYYPLMGIDNDYVEFKFEFLPGAGKKVTMSEIKITQVESDSTIGLISTTAAIVYQ